MMSAHASVGAAAMWPTTGTIFSAAEATRQGAAAKPQPDRISKDNKRTIRVMGRSLRFQLLPHQLQSKPALLGFGKAGLRAG